MKYLLKSDIIVPVLISSTIVLTNFVLRSVGVNNTIVHLSLFFLVFHLMMGLLLKYQTKTIDDINSPPLISGKEVRGFGTTIISIVVVFSLILANLKFVRMFIPDYFWVEPFILSIPTITLMILTRIIAEHL